MKKVRLSLNMRQYMNLDALLDTAVRASREALKRLDEYDGKRLFYEEDLENFEELRDIIESSGKEHSW